MGRKYFPISLCVYVLVAQFVTPRTIAHQVPLFLGFPKNPLRILEWVAISNPGNLLNMLFTYRINTYSVMETIYNQNYNI